MAGESQCRRYPQYEREREGEMCGTAAVVGRF